MNLINPILQTINNTLHIKADNLEPVEVDSSCSDEIKELALERYRKWQIQNDIKEPYDPILPLRLSISELSDRIQIVRNVNCPVGSPKAFLLPEKEDKELLEELDKSIIEPYAQFKYNKRTYTIEEIEKAINGVKLVPHYDEILKIIKKQILNNLKN